MRAQEVYKCTLCQNRHGLRYCPKFIKMTVEDRRVAVLRHKYCRNCLAKSHIVDDCQSMETCRKCGFQHHTMLHPRKVALKPKDSSATNQSTPSRHQRQEPRRPNNGQSTSSQSQRKPARPNVSVKSRLGQRNQVSAGQQQQQKARKTNRPKGQRHHQQPQRKPQRKPQSTTTPSTNQPNHLILSEAIKSLATVLCASSTNFA
ncbi:uncharacterized protein LOC131997137 [Stomoxys calcitrans]|nr:uncharacterized protein LOC131994155 [Stomoxys calcitrans]XP_059216965.1 uncharacterized protein LOC131994279 isoform X2 [Stomoxys calcitrans]XP_059216966.1 uncharacterized protein LOC131994279 isoform X2 [Stomoxys calcitrans]XP_059218233.1 uncharacterized protein LOC131994964 [Stomoxys calcitrans]XP_059218234.1 uncharacterized protein LOC131994964 [Stomoxys calcitrans]XP_059219575.1 uncharacterized protein LOC131995244 isoform X2 [Stomoxys calcitrans]XP_059219576.1 uncharacterized protein